VKQVNCQQATILLEPQGRNTTPAVALAAIDALAKKRCLVVGVNRRTRN